MRRRAEPQRLEEEPELLLRFLGRDAMAAKTFFLHRRIVQPDGTAGDLEPVEHQVVAVAEHPAGSFSRY